MTQGKQRVLSPNRFRILLWIAFSICIILSLSTGVQKVSWSGLLSGNTAVVTTVLISRIPRTMSLIITGAGLSIAGLIMQTITNNKFVSPSTAGTMEWCRFGIMTAILLAGGQSTYTKVILAFLVSLIGTLLFMFLLQKMNLKNAFMVPLIGMMMGNVISALTSFFAYKYDIIQNMSSWLQGNFSLIIKGNYEILYLGIPCVIIAYLYANHFTIAGMGESFSTSLGVNHKKITIIGLVIVAFMTSLIVVSVGSIAFVGLIIPNMVSMYRGDNIKGTLFDTALSGCVFLLICDLIGRTILRPYEISVGVIVSVIGSFLFLLLLSKKKR